MCPFLPRGWSEELGSVADKFARHRILRPRSVTSREHSVDLKLPTRTVDGLTLKREVPWLDEFYQGYFRSLGQRVVDELLVTARDTRIGINLNLQEGSETRYECHVDTNPLEGLLYVTDHPQGSGGELLVSQRAGARSVADVETCPAIIRPQRGMLVFFDARQYAHYVRPLVSGADAPARRIVVAMNYYTQSCPESRRPPDLTPHLFGEEP